MTTNSFKSLVRRRLRSARAENIGRPVIACLWTNSPHAQAIHSERHGRPIEPLPDDQSWPAYALDTWTVAEAASLLRRKAGIGGAVLANLIEDLPQHERSWLLLDVQEPSLRIAAFGGCKLFENYVLYDEIFDTVCVRCHKAAKGKGAVRFHLDDGQKVVVCGKTTKAMMATLRLVTVADSQCLPSISRGAMARLPLTEGDLALILSRLYSNQPHVVAEAILALRKVPGGRDAWLTRVLEHTHALKDLADAVRIEINGESRPDDQL
jgi:hypothetical protein